ncbi:MAG: helix-turn-helix domain-containing protein [Myxococcota bacterium]|nr:helix-turn-helix domain-containing protein [Myxococcota bacterium]
MRAQAKAQTRARILAHARSLFAERGFQGTTISAIAKAAQVSVGSVHAHFEDKDTLLAFAFHADLDERIAQGWLRAEDLADPIERLLAPVTALLEWYAQDPELARDLVSRSLFVKGEARAAFDAQIAGFTARVAGELHTAQDCGHIGEDIPVQLAAHGFMADYFATLLGGLREDELLVQELVGQLRALTRLRCGLR